jgi:membrane dipeptidase
MKNRPITCIADAHLDLPMDILSGRENGLTEVFKNKYYPMFKSANVNLIGASIYLDSIYANEMALRRGLAQIQSLYVEQEENPDLFEICKNSETILRTISNHKIAIVLTLEGIEPFMDDIRMLRIFYELGVRIIGLTWSRRNAAGDGALLHSKCQGTQGGLSPFAFQIIDEAKKHDMIIDVSHLNETGFWDLMGYSTGKIIASHSNSRRYVDVERNLSDEMMKAIAEKNGLIGINSMNRLLVSDDLIPGAVAVADEIDYIANLVGIEHVCFGFDLCDQLYGQTEQSKRPVFDMMGGYRNLHLVRTELKNKGYSDNEIKKVFGENYLQLFDFKSNLEKNDSEE